MKFALDVIQFIKIIPSNIANNEIAKQGIRCSGSIGANYIEANEALSKKDFIMRIKICRKESKESTYWLKLIESKNNEQDKNRDSLIYEATQLTKIFNAILEKSK